MQLANPLSLLWALPIAGAIVALYILKLRRKDVTVSSTFLWRQVIRDVQANAPFQKLRRNILLLLQIIAALFIIWAVARPFLRSVGNGGRNIVLIVDSSASMRATDIAPSRLDAAKRIAQTQIDEMHPGDMMMVISAAARPKAETGFTPERSELRHAVEMIKPTDTATNVRDALNLAADLVASRNAGDSGLIDLVSDGGFDSQGQNSGQTPNGGAELQYALSGLNLGKTHVAFFPVGAEHNNVGIIAVDFRRNIGGDKPTVQLLVVTHNYSDKPYTYNEEIYAGDNLVDAHEVTLAANAEDTQPYDLPEPALPTTMRVKLDVNDQLSTDNEASLILKPRKHLKVLLVGKPNVFLENALNVEPSVELSRSDSYPTPASAKGFDVVVFNEVAPAHLPEGNYLFIHCTSDQAPVKTSGTEDNVAAADWDHEHPALRYVDFGTDRFGSTLKASPMPWAKELAVSEAGSLVAAGEKDRMRSEFVGFSLTESMFPLRVAFPIFISNSVRWLGTGDDDNESGQIHTGETITIPAPPKMRLVVSLPDGAKQTITSSEEGRASFSGTDMAGPYTVTGDNFNYRFSANLASASESDITPHRTMLIADNPAASSGHRVEANRDLIPLFALLTLVILSVEWWAFHRRVYLS